MHKAKHSKFRNTGILFELLTRQVTSDILSGKDESFAKNILFKYFSESKELGKELQLYNFLVNEVAKDETQAEKYIEIVLKQRDKLNQKTLTSEKYNLIKEIKDVYPINDLFKSSITDNGVGDYTVNFTTAMPDVNYAVTWECDQVMPFVPNSNAVGNTNVQARNSVNTNADIVAGYVAIFR